MNNNLLELQNILKKNNIIISFSGKFYQGIIEELGEAIKKRMEDEETPKNDMYNIFSIFIEQSQNIRNYIVMKKNSNKYNKIETSGILSISKNEFGYCISSGNIVENEDINVLTEKLDLIKTMNKDELRKFYKSELKKEPSKDSLGAGVGLIDIARKSSKSLEYSFKELDDNLSFFQLQAIV